MTNKFAGITVFEDEIAIWARNAERRPLFRFNKLRQEFGVFRSKRISEAEVEFCLQMFEKLVPSESRSRRSRLEAFLNFELDQDVYCA